jgi:hypothetical protein
MTAFSSSLLDIDQNLKNEETGDEPAEERFDTAELVAVTLSGGNASITVRVTSMAGTQRAFIAPLKVTI